MTIYLIWYVLSSLIAYLWILNRLRIYIISNETENFSHWYQRYEWPLGNNSNMMLDLMIITIASIGPFAREIILFFFLLLYVHHEISFIEKLTVLQIKWNERKIRKLNKKMAKLVMKGKNPDKLIEKAEQFERHIKILQTRRERQ